MAALFRPVGAQSSGGGTAIPRSNPCSPPVVKESLLDQLPGCVGKLYQELEVYVEKERAAELERQLAAATAVVKQEPGIKQEPGMKQEGAGRRQELGLGSRGRERKRRRKSQLAAQRVTRSGTNKRHPSAPPGTPSRNLRSYGDVRGSTLGSTSTLKSHFWRSEGHMRLWAARFLFLKTKWRWPAQPARPWLPHRPWVTRAHRAAPPPPPRQTRAPRYYP